MLGTPFYVMEFLEGRIFADIRMPEIKDYEERRQWCGASSSSTPGAVSDCLVFFFQLAVRHCCPCPTALL